MKKLFTLLCLLGLTLNVCAQTTVTTYDFEDEVNIFTDDSRISSAVVTDEVLSSKVVMFTSASNCQNGYGFAHYDFTDLLDHSALVDVEFDYYNESGSRAILTLGDRKVRLNDGGCTKNTYGTIGAIFRIGSNRDYFLINGEQLPLADKESIYGFCDKWLHVSVKANIEAKIVEWTITDVATGNEVHSGSEPFWQGDASELSQIDIFAFMNNSMCGKIDNLTITNHKSDAAYADCKVRYVDGEGNELKEQRTDNAQVGSYIKLLDSDKESFFKDGQKYIYLEDNSATTAIASDGSTIITVTFRKAEKYYAVLNCMVEGGSGAANQLAEFNDPDKYWFFEGEQFNIYTSLGYKHTNGKYYFAKPNFYNGVWFTFPGDLTPETNAGKTYYIGRINYSLDESVAYYSDFERLALPVEDAGNGTGLGQLYGTVNSWYSFSGDYFNRFSCARSIRLDPDSYVWTEPIAETGNYRVVIYGRNDKSSLDDKPYELGLRDSDGNVTILNDLTIPAWEAAVTGQSVVENVSIPAGYSLVIMNEGTGKLISLDDITLFKTDGGGEKKVYTEFDEATGTLTYYYDDKMSSRSGITEVYDPVGHPYAVRFKGYNDKVLKAVIDPSMKDAPLTSMYSMFYGNVESDEYYVLNKITSIEGLENLNTTNVTDMSGMFYDCQSLTSLDITSFNTANVTAMSFMFSGCQSLTSLNLSSFNTGNVTYMSAMFQDCQSLTSLNLSSFNTGNVTYMSMMFQDCQSLTSLDLTSFNTAKVTDMSGMFGGCQSLTSLDLSSFNTANVTNMRHMFYYCYSLTFLDLSSFNTANVTDMSYMFHRCESLTALDLSSFNTANVTAIDGMFYYCNSLPALDISSFNTGNVTDMSYIFYNCQKLTTIFCDNDWSSSTATSTSMFEGCTALVGGKGTAYNSNFTDATYARPDGGTESPGYFTKIEPQVYTEFDEATGTLTYYYDAKMPSRSGVTELYDPVNQPLHFNNYYNKIVKVVIDPSMEKAPLTSTKNMFYGGLCTSPVRFQSLSALTSIEGLEYLNTKDVTDMTGMFTMCQSLTSLDLSSFNTSNVTTMNAMFSNCSSLQQVDVSSFDVSNVTDFGYMFSGCSKLTTILCSSDWSTGNAKSGSMFADCTALVGGMGTTFDASHRDKTYARPDGGTERPGYFTAVLIEGDLNGDGKVDIADAVAVLEVMAKDGNDPEADLNGDGKVDIADFVAVLEIMAKQ